MNVFDAMKAKTDYDQPLSISEVCEYLTLGRSTVYELLASRELAGIKLAGATRIKRSELQRYIDAARPVLIAKHTRR